MGLREQKKEETRQALLAKAGVLFADKGYQQVTTAEIARAVGIAEGTLFNYYRTKADLFLAALMPEPDAAPSADLVLECVSPRHLASALAELLDQELSAFERVSKSLLRDYFMVVYGSGLSGHGEARRSLFAADDRVRGRMVEFLVEQKRRASAPLAGMDVELAVSCLFGCTVTLMSRYVLEDDWTYDQLRAAMCEQMEFVLTGHVKA